MHMLRAESVCLRAIAWVGVCVITRLLLHVCVCVCLSLSQWVRRVGDSSNWSACVLLHSRHASHCTILLISSALCTCTHTHKLSHFFTVSLAAFRHGVTPHFARRFAHTIALLVCLRVCVCVEELQVWWTAGVSGVTWISAQHTPSRLVASGQQCFSFWSQSDSLKPFTACAWHVPRR